MTAEHYALLSDYLSRFYDVEVYHRHEVLHPVVHYEASVEQATEIDSILGHLSDAMPSIDEMAFYNYAYLHSLQNTGRNLFNGTTYNLKRLRTKPLRIDATLGHYFDMIATCGALEKELIDVIEAGMIRLPMRSQYHRVYDAQQSLFSGKGRSATIGAVMLIVFNDGERYQAIVSQRTNEHALDANALHLLPAFIFQPETVAKAHEEWSFKTQLYREYLEELVGMAEHNAEMHTHPALLDLQTMEADGRAEMRLTGVTLNLLTLRPEITALLVIHDADWWQVMQSGERGYRLDTPESSGDLLLLDVRHDDHSILAQLPEQYHLNMAVQAIPALWEGITTARILIDDYTRL